MSRPWGAAGGDKRAQLPCPEILKVDIVIHLTLIKCAKTRGFQR